MPAEFRATPDHKGLSVLSYGSARRAPWAGWHSLGREPSRALVIEQRTSMGVATDLQPID
jgi:hypothetical protein